MGLPVWPHPDEIKTAKRPIKDTIKNGITAARSPIRRHQPSRNISSSNTASVLRRSTSPQPIPVHATRSDALPPARSARPRHARLNSPLTGGRRSEEDSFWRFRAAAGAAAVNNERLTAEELEQRAERRRSTYRQAYLDGLRDARRARAHAANAHLIARNSAGDFIPPRLTRSPPLQNVEAHTSSLRNERLSASRPATLPTPPLERSDSRAGHHEHVAPPRNRHAYSPLFVVDDPSDSSSLIDPHSAINGLGDRTRSVSPEHGVDVWEIMQTTITPDPSLPSAESSFTGDAAAASASFTNDTDLRDGPPVTSAQRERSEGRPNRDPDTNYYLAQDCLYDDEDTDTETQMQTAHGQPDSARASVADAMQRLRRAIAVRQRLQSTADFSNPRPERFGAEVQERSQDARRETHRFFRSNSLPPPRAPRNGGEDDSDEDDGGEEARARPEGTEIGDTDLQAVFRLLENTDPEEAERDPEATDTLLRSLHRSLQAANERAEIALQEANATIARIEEGRRHIAAPDTDSLAGDVDELEQMRAIMERLERREQVPEEWWVAAGLDAAVGPQPEDAAEDGTIYATGRAPYEEGGRDWGILQVENGRVVFRAP